jgi:apolipoprotein N-acyltransferase
MPIILNLAFLDPAWAQEQGPTWVAAIQGMRDLCKSGAHLLMGALSVEPADRNLHNSVYFISPAGRLLGRYDKIRLVLFGEYVPLKSIFPFLAKFRPSIMGPDLSPGREREIFDLPFGDGKMASFGVTICYEDAEVGLVRSFGRLRPDFMVNVTNDGWFHDSSELDMHLAMCAFRAVETRVPWVRSTNTGVSAIIDATGRVTAKLTKGGRDRLIQGALKAETPLGNLASLYVRIGDAFVLILCVASFVLLAFAWRTGGTPAGANVAPPSGKPKRGAKKRKK